MEQSRPLSMIDVAFPTQAYRKLALKYHPDACHFSRWEEHETTFFLALFGGPYFTIVLHWTNMFTRSHMRASTSLVYKFVFHV